MSKKRRRGHEQLRPEKKSTPRSNSVSTLADAFTSDVLSRLKQRPGEPASSKPALATPSLSSSSKRPVERPSPSQSSVNSKPPIKVTPPKTSQTRGPETTSAPARGAKSDQSRNKESAGLAGIVTKLVPKPRKSIRAKGRESDGFVDWRSSVNSGESELRRNRYRELILNSLESVSQDSIDINLGIDLGTSFSKVVWRGTDKAYPVCFGENPSNLNNYLFPSIVIFDGRSFQTSLTASTVGVKDSIPNFKMCLACVSTSDQDCQPETCTLSNWWRVLNSIPEPVELVNATFLAQLISRSRELIRAHLKRLGLKEPAIRWSANLAVPEKYMDVSPTLECFQRVFRIAWLMAELSNTTDRITTAQEVVASYLCAKEISESGLKLDCFVYPEVAAEIASVTKSRQAKQGLYAFVDIGAGTVDGSVFRFHRPLKEDPSQFTYAASVIKSGAAHVEIGASEKLAETARAWFREMKEGRGKAAGLSLDSASILDPPFEDSLKDLKVEVRDKLIQLFAAAHEKEPGEFKWSDLQLIIGGGGATLGAYADAAKEAFSLKGNGRGSNLTNVPLEAPSNFEMGRLSRKSFNRFAVAYGLSFHHANLPEVVLAKDIRVAGSGRVRGPIIDPTMDD